MAGRFEWLVNAACAKGLAVNVSSVAVDDEGRTVVRLRNNETSDEDDDGDRSNRLIAALQEHLPLARLRRLQNKLDMEHEVQVTLYGSSDEWDRAVGLSIKSRTARIVWGGALLTAGAALLSAACQFWAREVDLQQESL